MVKERKPLLRYKKWIAIPSNTKDGVKIANEICKIFNTYIDKEGNIYKVHYRPEILDFIETKGIDYEIYESILFTRDFSIKVLETFKYPLPQAERISNALSYQNIFRMAEEKLPDFLLVPIQSISFPTNQVIETISFPFTYIADLRDEDNYIYSDKLTPLMIKTLGQYVLFNYSIKDRDFDISFNVSIFDYLSTINK